MCVCVGGGGGGVGVGGWGGGGGQQSPLLILSARSDVYTARENKRRKWMYGGLDWNVRCVPAERFGGRFSCSSLGGFGLVLVAVTGA